MQQVDIAPHQRTAIGELDNGKVLCGGVGTGKSRVSLQYYIEKEQGQDIVVITTAKKRKELDWESEAIKHGVGTDISMPGRGTITVDSWNNISKYAHDTGKFFIFDEQRVVGSGAWVQSFLRITRNNRWILLSATPGDQWLDYIPIFVANGYYKNRSEFIREHVVYSRFAKYPKVERFISTGKLLRLRRLVLVEMPYERLTTRHIMEVEVEHDEAALKLATDKRWDPYLDEPMKDAGALYRVARRLVNSDRRRLNKLKELLLKHPRIIVFYNFDYELDILRELGNCPLKESSDCSCQGLVVAEYNGHKHHPVPDSDHWVYLVQYQSGAEGWNCITTDAMVFYSLTYSYRNFEQSQGRTDRMNTSYQDLWYYVFKSNSWIDKAVWSNLRVKQNFNEKRHAVKSGWNGTE